MPACAPVASAIGSFPGSGPGSAAMGSTASAKDGAEDSANGLGVGSVEGSAPNRDEGAVSGSLRTLLLQKDPASQLPHSSGAPKSYRDASSMEENEDVHFGTLDFSDLNPTVRFKKSKCDTVSEYYKFALIGKFTYGKLTNQWYVGNIHPQVTEPLLQEVFSGTGPLEGCKLIRKEKQMPLFSMIRECHPSNIRSALKALLVRGFEVLSTENTREVKSYEYISHDAEGNRIQANIQKDLVSELKPMLSEGNLYGIKNFTVTHNAYRNGATNNRFIIIFINKTSICQLFDDTFPRMYVIRILTSKPATQTYVNFRGAETKFVEIVLMDKEKKTLTCTLWENCANELLGQLRGSEMLNIVNCRWPSLICIKVTSRHVSP
ncbi:hypothetical protein OROMI_016378 [Orobanche minor]